MKAKNHESWHRCQNCGHEYNFFDWGYDCPECMKPKTVGDFDGTAGLKKKINKQEPGRPIIRRMVQS